MGIRKEESMTTKPKLESVPAVERRAGVTMNYGDCNNRVLHGALEKLDNYTGFNVQDLSRFNKIKNAYDQKSKEVSRLFKKLVDKHALQEPVTREDKETGEQKPVLKPSGKPQTKPVMVPTGRGRMDFAFHDRKAFNKDYAALMAETFEVKAYCLLTEDLVKAGLTPKEIRACAKLLSDADPEMFAEPAAAYDEDAEEEALDEEENEESGPETPNADAPSSPPPEVADAPRTPGDVPTGDQPPQ
jgi:hypothetical protein